MTHSIRPRLVAPLLIALVTCITLPHDAYAREPARSGGNTRAANTGNRTANTANTANRPNSAQSDARTNNVRSTSANSVNNSNNVNSNRNVNANSNRNVNVNVDSNNGCCNNGWDNDYHPLATAAAVTATVAVIGSIVRQPPSNCVPVNHAGVVYQQCGSTWYQPQNGQYVVIAPPY